MPSPSVKPGLILVGGGLANSLIAYRLRQTRPGLPITLLERGSRIGGNHTWSFHETDVSPETFAWLRPFVVHRWTGQSVRFANRRRSFATPYCSISSERLHELMSWTLGSDARCGVEVRRVAPKLVETADGERIAAGAVIDGRGAVPRRHLDLGWQKFVGLEVATGRPHGLSRPIIMDAAIPQTDGFRFIYVLPLAPDRLLIEDTRYSDAAAYCARSCAEDILAYAADRGWSVEKVLRSEEGALPIALDGDIGAICAGMGEVARSGLAAALFHPTTGYSLPDAARLAETIAAAPRLDAETLPGLVTRHVRATWRRRGLYRLLNRMLFRAARPEERHRVIAHFYRLPRAVVERFYGDRLSLADKARILTGRPPVPVWRALSVAWPSPRPNANPVLEPRS